MVAPTAEIAESERCLTLKSCTHYAHCSLFGNWGSRGRRFKSGQPDKLTKKRLLVGMLVAGVLCACGSPAQRTRTYRGSPPTPPTGPPDLVAHIKSDSDLDARNSLVKELAQRGFSIRFTEMSLEPPFVKVWFSPEASTRDKKNAREYLEKSPIVERVETS